MTDQLNNDILDLDALAPKPKKIKINGKIIECYPPRVLQLIELVRVWEEIQAGNVAQDQVVKVLVPLLEPIVPAIKDDKTIDFNTDQLVALIKFAMAMANETAPKEVQAAATTEEKKTPIAEQSPAS